jgi:hypothetical protein
MKDVEKVRYEASNDKNIEKLRFFLPIKRGKNVEAYQGID